eukprot:1394714-Amorphochlora_amoeboformis.AAC.2
MWGIQRLPCYARRIASTLGEAKFHTLRPLNLVQSGRVFFCFPWGSRQASKIGFPRKAVFSDQKVPLRSQKRFLNLYV